MISPVALLWLTENATVTTPDGDISPETVGVAELSEHDADTIQARIDAGTIYIPKNDIKLIIDLTDLEFRPIDIDDIE